MPSTVTYYKFTPPGSKIARGYIKLSGNDVYNWNFVDNQWDISTLSAAMFKTITTVTSCILMERKYTTVTESDLMLELL